MIDNKVKNALHSLMEDCCSYCRYVPGSPECNKEKSSCNTYQALHIIADAVGERDTYKDRSEMLENDLSNLIETTQNFDKMISDTEFYWRKYKESWPASTCQIIVTDKAGNVGVGYYDVTIGNCILTTFCKSEDIIAWMPMPCAYKE